MIDSHPCRQTRGILTLAHGQQRYIDMAKSLAASLRLHNDAIPRALITDSTDPELEQLFHTLIPMKPEYGRGVQQKLFLDRYSPFDETLFIDSDCLVVSDIEWLWSLFSTVPFGVIGGRITTGYWFMDVEDVRARLNLDALPLFNGGVYYFKRGTEAEAVFTSAREIAQRYTDLGLGNFRGSINDEAVISLALATNGVAAVGDERKATMYTPIGHRGPIDIDVLRGFCRFNKHGTPVQPAIMHFCGPYALGFYYRRECLKLHLAMNTSVRRSFISLAVNALSAPLYPLNELLEAVYAARKRWRARQSPQVA